ncbi:MAG: hypothetical protein JO110_15315 [Acetobacteraceae bacterium]|nr:hypothetical protein [Acetobacteraceae bacterium]
MEAPAAPAGDQESGRRRREGTAWSVEEEHRLYDGFTGLSDIAKLAVQHARTNGAIRSRLLVLGLIDPAGQVVAPKPAFTPSPMTLRRTVMHTEAVPTISAGNPRVGDAELLFLELLNRLRPERRAIVMEVLRGLVALEENSGAASRPASPAAAPAPERPGPSP